jgi:hypothetical protein
VVTPAHHIASYVRVMNEGQPARSDNAGEYVIAVQGRLTARWDEWFDGFTLRPAANGTTLITGFVVDQAALHGVLRKLADLGLPLISVSNTNLRETQ